MPATEKRKTPAPKRRRPYRRGPPPVRQQNPDATPEQVAEALLRPLRPVVARVEADEAVRGGKVK